MARRARAASAAGKGSSKHRHSAALTYATRTALEGVLFATPSQDYDDAYQIEYARNHDGVIISNDLFRDAVDKQPFMRRAAFRTWLKQHVMSFAFIGDEFCPNPEFQLPFLARGPVSILQ